MDPDLANVEVLANRDGRLYYIGEEPNLRGRVEAVVYSMPADQWDEPEPIGVRFVATGAEAIKTVASRFGALQWLLETSRAYANELARVRESPLIRYLDGLRRGSDEVKPCPPKQPKRLPSGLDMPISHLFRWLGSQGYKAKDGRKICEELKIDLPRESTIKTQIYLGRKWRTRDKTIKQQPPIPSTNDQAVLDDVIQRLNLEAEAAPAEG